MSLYANFVGHWAAYQGAHAEERIARRVEKSIREGKCKLGDLSYDEDYARLVDKVEGYRGEVEELKKRTSL